MTNLTMWDTAFSDQFPPDGEAYAAYVDGSVGSQPNYQYIVETFPKAQHLSIAIFAGDDAEALDVEPGASLPTAVPGWYSRQRERGVKRPCIYASADPMEAFVLPLLVAADIPRQDVRLWSAHYAGEHICSPASCGALSVEADGTQWTSTALGRDLDQSLLLGDFFDVPVPPKPPADWTYGPPRDLRAIGGHTSVRLAWEPPAGAPVPPAAYLVFIYAGTVCDRSTLVKTYPRRAEATAWEGGSLQQGAEYSAHVVASGPHGSRIKPFVYASATFSTG